MKGWILLEDGFIVETSLNSVEVFKTKRALLDYYGAALGELDTIKKVSLNFEEERK